MRIFMALLFFLSSLILGACTEQAVDCSSAIATDTVIPIVREQVERLLTERARNAPGGRFASRAEIRATIGQVQLALADIRTTNRDPNSTRRFCSGVLRITVPAELIQTADRTRQANGNDTVSDLADRSNVDRSADRFEADVEYSIQPTDDGSRIYAEIPDAGSVYGFLAELLASHLMASEIQQAQAQAAAAQAQEQQLANQQAAEQEAALVEQRRATVEQARAELQLAEQRINAVWQSIPEDTRSNILALQRAWLRSKAADCRIEAASASTISEEREAARLRCETRLNNERSNYLRQYVGAG